MTTDARITALEARLAAAEARIAQLERQQLQPATTIPGTWYPPLYYTTPDTIPRYLWEVTCGTNSFSC